MMTLQHFLEFINYLTTFILPAYGQALGFIQRAEQYDQGILKPKYKSEYIVDLNLSQAASEKKLINKGVAGFCIHDMDNIGPGSVFYDKLIETYRNEDTAQHPQIRYEVDFDIIYNCDSGKILQNRIDVLNYHFDKAFEMGYEPRVWLVKIPQCLKLPFYYNLDLGILSSERPPKDKIQWEGIIRDVVRTFTKGRTDQGKKPVTKFEMRGEVDLPNSFSGSYSELQEYIIQPTARAIQTVENEVGYELELAMCSNSNGVGLFNTRHQQWQLTSSQRNNHELEYVNWHEYGHYPFAAGDEATDIPILNDNYFRPLARSNPWATSKQHYQEIKTHQSLFPGKKYMIGEWNYAGFEEYANSVYSGAYMCGSLIEMENAGLDIATSFLFKGFNELATCSITNTDTITPQGYALLFFHNLAKQKIPLVNYIEGDTTNDVSIIASRNDDRISVIISRFYGVPDSNNSIVHLNIRDITSFLPTSSNKYGVAISSVSKNTPFGTTDKDTSFYALMGTSLDFNVDVKPNSFMFIEIKDSSSLITKIPSNLLSGINFNVYPNPNKGDFTLTYKYKNKIDIEFFDITGHLIYQQSDILENSTISLNKKINTSGSFIIKCSDNGTYLGSKVIQIY